MHIIAFGELVGYYKKAKGWKMNTIVLQKKEPEIEPVPGIPEPMPMPEINPSPGEEKPYTPLPEIPEPLPEVEPGREKSGQSDWSECIY